MQWFKNPNALVRSKILLSQSLSQPHSCESSLAQRLSYFLLRNTFSLYVLCIQPFSLTQLSDSATWLHCCHLTLKTHYLHHFSTQYSSFCMALRGGQTPLFICSSDEMQGPDQSDFVFYSNVHAGLLRGPCALLF